MAMLNYQRVVYYLSMFYGSWNPNDPRFFGQNSLAPRSLVCCITRSDVYKYLIKYLRIYLQVYNTILSLLFLVHSFRLKNWAQQTALLQQLLITISWRCEP